jgi:hypothetical protein
MAAVVGSHTLVLTVFQSALRPIALDVILPDLAASRILAAGCVHFAFAAGKTQLSASDLRIYWLEKVVTHCAPHTIVPNLHPS